MLPVENAVLALQRAMYFEARCVRFNFRHVGRDFFGKEELPGVTYVIAEVNLEMNMNRAARIPARIKRSEFNPATVIGDLHSAQKAARVQMSWTWRPRPIGWPEAARVESRPLFVRARPARPARSPSEQPRPHATGRSIRIHRREARVHTQRIAVPDIDGRIIQRLAAFCVHQLNAKLQRDTRLSFRDAPAQGALVDVIRSLLLFRG